MNFEILKQHCQEIALRIRQREWPRLVHWLEAHRPRSLFLRALLIGLLLSVPWQCSRWIYQTYLSTDDNTSMDSGDPLRLPGSLSGSITNMPNPKARRPAPETTTTAGDAIDSGIEQPQESALSPTQATQGNHDAAVLERVAPKYPTTALRNNDTGTVTLNVQLDASGHPDLVRIEKSSGSRDLDRAAREAVMQWKFSPKIETGKPVASEILVPVEFKLGE
jgi:protein TonB